MPKKKSSIKKQDLTSVLLKNTGKIMKMMVMTLIWNLNIYYLKHDCCENQAEQSSLPVYSDGLWVLNSYSDCYLTVIQNCLLNSFNYQRNLVGAMD